MLVLVACHSRTTSTQTARDASADGALDGAGARSAGGASAGRSGEAGSAPDSSVGGSAAGGSAGVAAGGVVAMMHPDGFAALVDVQGAGKLLNVSAQLDAVSSGADKSVAISPDGAWLALTTTRFGCGSWDCLALVPRDLSRGEAISAGGGAVHPDRPLAVGPGGSWIAFSDQGGTHSRDVFVSRKVSGAWGERVALSDRSPYAYNAQPAPAPGGDRVVFDCGNAPYGGDGTAICSAAIDGTDFRVLLSPGAGVAQDAVALHHAAYAPDGSLVFEMNGRATGERVWRLSAGKLQMLGEFRNDNSPCVLPSGVIASLYLGRDGNASGAHELKLMSASGAAPHMALTGVDIVDSQISCGK